MPEFYYGVADPDSFGLSGNFIYPFKAFLILQLMTPYAGIGAGIIKIEDDVSGYNNGTNLKYGRKIIYGLYY
jgi:hypothetical protein